MKNRHSKENRRAMQKSIALILTIFVAVAMVPGLFKLFQSIDCHTATRNIEYIDACIANENCTLRPYELQRLEAYTRLQLKSCPVE